MNLRNDIINNWKTDIVGFAHSIDSLERLGYCSWTVKDNEQCFNRKVHVDL